MAPARKPEWLRQKIRMNPETREMIQLLRRFQLNSVCEEAKCPNRSECFERKTATFMILGANCTRNCTFCTVTKGEVGAPDPLEPKHVAEAVSELGLQHVVITSVTRDDLLDGGASHFAKVIRAIQSKTAGAVPIIEVLIPDFQGDEGALAQVIEARPAIINHNVETVPRLYSEVRQQAEFARSLALISRVKAAAPDIFTKSGMMLGLGETHEEVLEALEALRKVGCDMLTLGQYLAPSAAHHPVVSYITQEEFAQYEREARAMGYLMVSAGPLVRSSYMAKETFSQIRPTGEAGEASFSGQEENTPV